MKYIVICLTLLITGFSVSYSNEYFNQKVSRTKDEHGKPLYHRDRIYVKFKKEVNLSHEPTVFSRQSKVDNYFGIASVDEILKTFGCDRIEQAFKQVKELPKKVSERFQKSYREIPDLSRIYMIKLSSPVNSNKLIKELNNNSNIEYAEYVPIDYPMEVPNDSLYSQCQHLPQIKAEQAWDVIKGENSDSTIIIGICDTGTDWNHPDLTGNLWQNLAEDADKDGRVLEWDDSLKKYILDPGDLNGSDDDGNGFVDDLIGWDFLEDYEKDSEGNNPQDFNNHGTHVAGISAGTTNNSIGISSISWNVKYVPTSHSAPGFNYIVWGFEGIVYLAELGCDVINCSWGGGGYSRANAEAVEYADAIGALVVVAAGNGNSTEAFYPSSYPHVISIASVASTDVKAGYSNYGNHVDISAPGGNTGIDGGIMSCVRNSGYMRMQGTSMASPVAAGVFGLVRAKYPDWTNEKIKKQVIGTADNIDSLNPNYKNMLGNGRVNAFRALTETEVDVPKILKLDLMNVEADDSTDNSNKNKALEPGENIRIGFLIRNYAILTGSTSTNLVLSCNDEDIEIIESTYNVEFTPDGYTETPLIFEIKISDSAESKFIDFTLTAVSDDAEIVMGNIMNFKLPVNNGGILIWEGQSYAQGYSGKFISDFLTGQGIQNIYTTTFPVSMVGYDAVLLSFGAIGSGLSSTPLNDWMAQDIADYLKSGGKLYLEGMDVLGFDQALNKEFLTLFGIDSSSDGSDKYHSIDTIFGMQGTICEGLTFWKSDLTGYQSIDEIFPDANGKVALFEPLYGNAAVQNEGSFGQKTFVGVYPLAHLTDRKHPNSRYELIKRILDFFDIHIDYTIPRFSYYPKTGHAPKTIQYNDESYSSRKIVSWTWDFKGNSEEQIKLVDNVRFEFEEPGDYLTKMTISDGEKIFSTSNPVYIFDGESSAYFEDNKLGQIADTNLNIRNAYTVECWIMPDAITTGAWQVIADKIHVSLNINNSRTIRLYTYHDDRSITDLTTSPESVTFNTWQHITASFDGDSTFKVYINGKEQQLKFSRGPGKGKVRDNLNAPFTIGRNYDWYNGFEGRIDEFRLWNKQRTQQEIRSSMFKKISGSEEGLMLYWQFNEGAGDTAKDYSNNNRTCKLNSDWRQGIHEGHIIMQPKSNIICEDKAYVVSAEVISGPDSLIYQWTKNGKLLQNTPEAKYYIDEMSESNVGKYQLILTNADTYDREFSDTALIDIDTKPVITEEPNNNLEFKIGDTLHLKIKAESKSDLTYEWFKDDETLDYYEAEYTKEIINEEDEGRYNCFVMNNCDIVASNYVYVWVLSDVEDNNGNDIWFDIVPNPVCSNSILNIHSHDRRDCILSVVDILGQEIYNKKLIFMGDDIYRLNIFDIFENKNSGFYWITLKIDNILVSKPVLFVK